MRGREAGLIFGSGETGERNLITDVPGVLVGHCTVDTGDVHTGVTAVIPGTGLAEQAFTAAVHVLNGYGKTAGTVQIEELGRLETPVLLTNTLGVGVCLDALAEYMTDMYKKAGKELVSINGVVGETNDSRISDIARRAVRKEHVFEALDSAASVFELGSAGAGRGTVCFGLKGGIGSASRRIRLGSETYTLGILVQSNFGALQDLTVCGQPLGRQIAAGKDREETDRGSIMAVLATDLPLSDRQLKRVVKRIGAGIIRTGSHMGHGSGDVFIGFTTANRIPLHKGAVYTVSALREELLDKVFRSVIECTEEAVIDSMLEAEPVKGIKGKRYPSLKEYMK
ncbi:MAG: P1 family peptidase [Solobacterium sp.]|nr:P1 family peptidase [Solobacterium sp.]